jgi:Asp-tRNA(Asn)/Glu-tRNA(Gln) amidotransferase A subunit family amidase
VLPPRVEDDTVELGARELPHRLVVIPWNSPWSLAGSPVVSVPCGLVDGLPVGLALVGPRLAEAAVLRVAHSFQQATDWHERWPPLATPSEGRVALR